MISSHADTECNNIRALTDKEYEQIRRLAYREFGLDLQI